LRGTDHALRLKHKTLVTGLAWHPDGTTIGFGDRTGFLNTWVDVVPKAASTATAHAHAHAHATPGHPLSAALSTSTPAPAAPAPLVSSAPAAAAVVSEERAPSDDGDLVQRRRPGSSGKRRVGVGLDDGDAADATPTRGSPSFRAKRARQYGRALAYDVDGDPLDDDDDDDDGVWAPRVMLACSATDACCACGYPGRPAMQEVFQPSSTPMVKGRGYLGTCAHARAFPQPFPCAHTAA
jgi:hypothetical protein